MDGTTTCNWGTFVHRGTSQVDSSCSQFAKAAEAELQGSLVISMVTSLTWPEILNRGLFYTRTSL